MEYSNKQSKAMIIGLLTLIGVAIQSPAIAAKVHNWGDGYSATELDERFDTSFAVEYSYSCVSGGCHETDTQLVEEYADSFMTHVMVKCDACHGTHTADDVGQEKPDLTGYYPGIGVNGYLVGDDRCIACHTATLDSPRHLNSMRACADCHTPHRFSTDVAGRSR